MKNYYEILEVDKNASQEVIEKAYRTLAKKYHPDLQRGVQQQECAEKMKIINQAYDVLSNSLKRQEYNQKLENERLQRERIQYQKMQEEARERQQNSGIRDNYDLNQQLNRKGINNQTVGEDTILNMTRILSQEINAARKRAYYDVYTQELKNRGYKIKYKHNLKYYLKLCLLIAITAFVCFLICQIPIVKNFFTELYNENILFKAIIDIFKNTFSATF